MVIFSRKHREMRRRAQGEQKSNKWVSNWGRLGYTRDISNTSGDIWWHKWWFHYLWVFAQQNPTKHGWYLLAGEHRVDPWNRIGMFLGIAMGRAKKNSQLFTMNWLWVGNHVPVFECQYHHILSCHMDFKFIPICSMYGIFTYMTGWFLGPMFVNILYMEHMGYDSGWETRRKTATQGQPGKQRGNT